MLFSTKGNVVTKLLNPPISIVVTSWDKDLLRNWKKLATISFVFRCRNWQIRSRNPVSQSVIEYVTRQLSRTKVQVPELAWRLSAFHLSTDDDSEGYLQKTREDKVAIWPFFQKPNYSSVAFSEIVCPKLSSLSFANFVTFLKTAWPNGTFKYFYLYGKIIIINIENWIM